MPSTPTGSRRVQFEEDSDVSEVHSDLQAEEDPQDDDAPQLDGHSDVQAEVLQTDGTPRADASPKRQVIDDPQADGFTMSCKMHLNVRLDSGEIVVLPGLSVDALVKDMRSALASVRPLPPCAAYQLLCDDEELDDSEALPANSVTATVRDLAAEAGFTITPSLIGMKPAELRQVSELTVFKEEVGSITFHGTTDCTDLDIVHAVHFGVGQVQVYTDPKSRPAVGQGLNKPATVTMYQCWPPTSSDQQGHLLQDQETRDRYVEKIQKMTEDNRAKLVDYNCDSGIWRFEVEHF